MQILVTGSTGFVGKEVVKHLQKLRFRVHATARRKIDNASALYHVVDGAGPNTNWSIALNNCDVVIHLAARVHVLQDPAADPLVEFRKVNLHGSVNLARQAAQAGVKRFVYVSSIKVNGEFTDLGHPFKESDEPDPQDPYAISKWEAEQALHMISRDTGMEVAIVRPPLVYGPGVKANFAKLLKLVDHGVPLPLANVRNSRSLIYVGNLVDALVVCATHPAAAGQTFLVSDGEDVSTPHLIRAMAIALDRPARLIPMPIALMRCAAKMLGKLPAIERLTQSLVIDSSKIRAELNWTPPYTMAQGLRATAEWYRATRP